MFKFALPLLLVIFVTLKILHFITWSWWLVLLPLFIWITWIPVFFIIAFCALILKEIAKGT